VDNSSPERFVTLGPRYNQLLTRVRHDYGQDSVNTILAVTRYYPLAILCAVSLGCGDKGRIETYRATGSVEYMDGQAIESGSVLFVATDGQPPARAMINNGRFTLGTYEESDGAAAGSFQVAVLLEPPADYDPDAGRAPPTADTKYGRPETSGLSFEVAPDADNDFEIKLERSH
jgi:hypothetical protein